MCWWHGGYSCSFRLLALLLRKFLQCLFEGGFDETFAEFMQLALCCAAQDARSAYDRDGGVAHLHLDPDSANLAPPVLHFVHDFRRQLAQFCGECAVIRGDVECAVAQPRHLAGLCDVGWRDMGKLPLQRCQGLRGVEQVAQLRVIAHQGF